MKKKVLAALFAAVMACSLIAGCGGASSAPAAPEEKTEEAAEEAQTKEGETGAEAAQSDAAATETAAEETAPAAEAEEVELQVFIAASLNTCMQEVAAKYNEEHPNVKIVYNADSSGKLLTQIEEGYTCDVFFSAAQKQMNTLEEDGLIVEGTRADVVNNQVVVIKRKDTESAVTGLETLGKASSIAMADGSVPVGRYTRTALMNLGILPEAEDASVYTTAEVSEALGGVEISEQGNVSQVLTAVAEGSCEVGTTYYSDTYGYEDQIDVLETVSYDLTGNVIYPVCQVVNDEATDAQKAAAADFVSFITSDTAKAIFMQDILQILAKLDWSPLYISIKTGIVATFISFFLGIFAARKVLKASGRVRAVIDGILTLPMVLPPTVAGFFLLLLFSRRRPLGILLYENFSIKVVQTWLGCIVAATVIAFPLMYRNARAAFEQIDPNLVYAGRTLGMSEMRIFWTVVIPTAGPGIASGTILTFARALGEYGATSMLAGNIPSRERPSDPTRRDGSQETGILKRDGNLLERRGPFKTEGHSI